MLLWFHCTALSSLPCAAGIDSVAGADAVGDGGGALRICVVAAGRGDLGVSFEALRRVTGGSFVLGRALADV